MDNSDKQLTSDEVDELMKKFLPRSKDELLNLHEKVRQNMHSGYAETQSYKQRQDFLREIETRLHWINVADMYGMNKRMFWVAIASSIITLISVILALIGPTQSIPHHKNP